MRKSREKNTDKGITELSNIPNGLLTVSDGYGYLKWNMSGYSAKRFSRKGFGLIGKWREASLDWDINDVFNDSTTQEVNWHRHDAG